MTRLSLLLAVLMGAALLDPAPAHAASGWVEGFIKHYQNQGNFCPTSRNCTGARYLQAEYQTVVPARQAYVYLRDQNDTVIGTGTTSSTGYFKFQWTSPTTPTSGSIIWMLKHSGSRFQIFAPSGATWILWSSVGTIVNGTTSSSPQDLGTRQWGSSGSPHTLTNAYDGAEKMWEQSLKYSNRMLNFFASLDIRAFSSSVPNAACNTSCAFGAANQVQLDGSTGTPFSPQGRVMHEMGHIASYKSNPFLPGGDYCFPSTGTGCGWNQTTAEWRAASFEEGIATFFGDTAIYWYSNPQPHTCLSTSACTLNSFDVEASTGSGSCATNEGRWALSANRYLRDMYDSVNDPGFGEAMTRPYGEFFETLATFANGTSDDRDDEPWNSSRTALDNRDGRAACDDFAPNFTTLTGLLTTNQCANNCSP